MRSTRPVLTTLVAAVTVVAACSGGGSDDESADSTVVAEDPAATGVTTPAESEPDDGGSEVDPGSAPGSASTTSTTTTSTTTTTTLPPPEPLPLGVRWAQSDALVSGVGNARVEALEVVGDTVWLLAGRWNGLYVARSDDRGATWIEVPVDGPSSNAVIRADGIVRGADGRLVLHGRVLTRCDVALDVGEGFVETGICRRFRPVIWLSDDDGATWRRVEPAAMGRPGDSSVELVDVVVTPDGFAAAGTVRGPDWHVRLWSSPDGETWSLDREIRGPTGAISADDLVWDGTTLLLAASEHPCPNINDNTPGWILGAAWADHVRLFSGATIGELALLGPGDHPFALPPSSLADCALVTGFDLSRTDPYPAARAERVGDSIVVIEVPNPVQSPEDDEDDEDTDAGDEEEIDPETAGTRRLAQLVDGAWEVVDIDGVSLSPGFVLDRIIDVNGQLGLFETAGSGNLTETRPILPDPAGGFAVVRSDPPLVTRSVGDAVVVGDTIITAGYAREEPFADVSVSTDIRSSLFVWTSSEALDEPLPCDLAAGGVCRFVDLEQVDGYPDFGGLDLTGIDLSFSNLGAADFSGSNLTDARLWEVSSLAGSRFVGADFTRADLGGADLGTVTGANFTDATLVSVFFGNADGAVFAGADLDRGSMLVTAVPDANGVDLTGVRLRFQPADDGTYDVSLAGLDLTDVSIDGDRDEDRLLVVTDLTGATLDDASFQRVDLSLVDPAVDLTEVDVWDDSICPDGLPPDDGPIGTCVRTE